jgi:rubredoxin
MTSSGNEGPDRAKSTEPTAAVEPDVVVDLAATDEVRSRLRRLSHPSRFPDVVPCPECGGPGDLDTIDLAADVREQRCDSCGHVWTLDIGPS